MFDHMKPGHPHWDRPAPECDDQLPLIARAGRGLRGDGYLVQIKQDSDCETYLEGLKYDAASNTYSSDWISENINGGKIMYQYNLRPYTNPQTFTITFRVKRPNRPEWQWTTPAIPYIWDADNDGIADVDGIVGTGVADLFLKKTTESKWNYPTITYTQYKNGQMTWEKHDKLVYPDDWTRDMFNAPIPGDPWSVNLQYGIGGDIDAPNVDDLAKILGITVENIRSIIKTSPDPTDTIPDINLKTYIDRRDLEDFTHLHKDMGFGDHLIGDDNDKGNLTVKKYIDNMIDNILMSVFSGDENLLTINKTTYSHDLDGSNFGYGIKFEFNPTDLVAGTGIGITYSGSDNNKKATISNKIINGPGIQIEQDGDSWKITNTQVGGKWKLLTAGVDYDYTWHNGWFGTTPQSDDYGHPGQQSKPSSSASPAVRIIPTYDSDGKTIVGAEVRISSPTGEDILANADDMLDTDRFKFKHSTPFEDCPQAAMLSITFKGNYAVLNNLSIQNSTSKGSNIWNIRGTNDSIRSSTAGWHNCGASWMCNCSFGKNVSGTDVDGRSYRTFAVFAGNLADGYNAQYGTPSYGYSHLCVRPWANWDWQITLM